LERKDTHEEVIKTRSQLSKKMSTSSKKKKKKENSLPFRGERTSTGERHSKSSDSSRG